jgi:hypothetical protein
MCVFIFSLTFVWNISHFKENPARYYYKCTYVFLWGTSYSCRILMKLELSQQVFEKYSNTNFHENSSTRSRVVICEPTYRQTEVETDRHDEADSRFSQFYELAWSPTNRLWFNHVLCKVVLFSVPCGASKAWQLSQLYNIITNNNFLSTPADTFFLSFSFSKISACLFVHFRSKDFPHSSQWPIEDSWRHRSSFKLQFTERHSFPSFPLFFYPVGRDLREKSRTRWVFYRLYLSNLNLST